MATPAIRLCSARRACSHCCHSIMVAKTSVVKPIVSCPNCTIILRMLPPRALLLTKRRTSDVGLRRTFT
jgi:hypothetical protein